MKYKLVYDGEIICEGTKKQMKHEYKMLWQFCSNPSKLSVNPIADQ